MYQSNQTLFDSIAVGDKVTIYTKHGGQLKGNAVILCKPTHVVLNLGGRYGTPGIATPDNTIKVKAAA